MQLKNQFPSSPTLRWFFHRLINRITLRKTKKYSGQLWLGAFKTFEEMENYVSNSSWSIRKIDEVVPYPNKAWMAYAKKIELPTIDYGTPLSELELERHRFLIEYCSSFKDLDTILDIGAGLNPCYFTICKTRSNAGKNLICDAIELPGVTAFANNLYSSMSRLNYYDDYPENKKYDIAYLGSSLHYIFDLDIFFQTMQSYSTKNIIATYSPVAEESNTFFSAPFVNENLLSPNITYNLNYLKENSQIL